MLLTFDLVYLVGWQEIEPLITVVHLGTFQDDGGAGLSGSKNRSNAIAVEVGNAETPAGLLVQVQAGGSMEIFDDADDVSVNVEVAFKRTVDSESIFDILADTVSWESGVALPVGRDNAELKLLEVLVASETSNKQIVGELPGNEALQCEAFKLKGLILLDESLGNASVGLVRISCQQRVIEGNVRNSGSWSWEILVRR